MKVHPMWQEYPELQVELEKTLALIKKNINVRNKDIEATIIELINSGGKLLRPAYSLLFSKFGTEQNPEKARAIAAALEILHMATLIHDDIVDDSPTRRGTQTIQAKYSKDVAVYAGDYLFTVCFKLLARYSSSLESIEIDTRGMERILMGELDQMHLRYNQKITVRQYLTQISGKTAQLFALSCYSGALESGTSKKFSRNCYYIGNHIGMAFQIMDDILDYSQDDVSFGKPVLEDVRQGVYSIPLIFALRKQPKSFAPYLDKKDKMTEEDIQAVHQLVIELGGLAEAQDLATKYTAKALKDIKKLPNIPEKEIIMELTTTMLERTF
ncbi:polyprenyl synthetase family protein [Carnobacterium gallinarum]|uniref:polyprenyl synthetase family protein n=1 Tax=Carnobacterium gallinarum TaxID=2749 RepID=UPI00055598C4|nr:polyprenyl synthetase family protein [Carnobacterium gallinarum]